MAHNALAGFAFFAYLAGLTSTIGVLISAVNSQARLDLQRRPRGPAARWIGRVHPVRKTPVNAIFVFVGIASAHHPGLGTAAT